jgi:hypothetical protein
MNSITEPPDIDAAVTFRRLLQLPRPTLALDFQFPGFRHEPLVIQALTSLEFTECVTSKNFGVALAQKALLFPEILDDLPEYLTTELVRAVQIGLGAISPLFVVSDRVGWERYLRAGAREPVNSHTAYILSQCQSDQGFDRPDRFFGVSFNQLIDAHWIVYQVCCDIYRNK